MNTTVVSALYTIKSKFPQQKYIEWGKTFLKLEAPIVLFTDKSLAPIILEMRGDRPIKIITIPFEELEAWTLFKDKWIQNHEMDPEKSYHSPELYAIWAQKIFFVKNAIELNPFNTNYFFWHDFGGFRNPNINEIILKTFPQDRYFKDDKLLLQGLYTLQDYEKQIKEDGIYGMKLDKFWNQCRLVGGLWGGSQIACLNWFEKYKSTLEKYFEIGRFAGKDQIVMLSTYLENPNLAIIVENTVPNIDEWFFLQYLLSDTNTHFKLNESYKLTKNPTSIVSVNIMGGLGNQMFQLATGYAYAKKYNGKFIVQRNKRYFDNRPLYWDSQLKEFTPYLVDSVPSDLVQWTETGPLEFCQIPPLTEKGIYLNGYLQSEKYFNDEATAKELRTLFRPPQNSLEYVNSKFKGLLENKDRVIVVHARRTDYLRNQDIINFHGPLTLDYYKTAISKISQGIKDPIFLLASDDPLFWLYNFEKIPELNDNQLYILNNENEIDTLTLLRQFHYYVIANSTFSWWATWLSEGPRKVIAPAKWFGPTGPKNYQDIYCSNWELV